MQICFLLLKIYVFGIASATVSASSAPCRHVGMGQVDLLFGFARSPRTPLDGARRRLVEAADLRSIRRRNPRTLAQPLATLENLRRGIEIVLRARQAPASALG